MKLRRYWFEFDVKLSDCPYPLGLGCGVTGFDEEDCRRLIQEMLASNEELPPMRRIIADMDVSTLDPNHVLPNMGIVTKRGIWFPLMSDWHK